MDKQEYEVAIDTIKNLAQKGDFKAAARLVDEMDWKKEKSIPFICLAEQIYENQKEYDKAKELLLTAYENTPLGRQLAYRLCLLCVKMGQIEEAEEYYLDFSDMAPMDSGKYLLQYQIAKAKGQDYASLIAILETYMEEDMDEKWGYELAKLYSKAGEPDKCVRLCDELSLWFNDGKYVVKALGLKRQIKELTPKQEEIYEKGMGFSDKEKVKEEPKEETETFDTQKPKEDEMDVTTLGQKLEHSANEQDPELEAYLAKTTKSILDEDKEKETVANTAKLDEAIAMAKALAAMDKEALMPKKTEPEISEEEKRAKEEQELKNDMEDTGFSKEEVKKLASPVASQEEEDGVLFETKEELPKPKAIKYDEPPLFTMEKGGQISLDVPEHVQVESQITGQLSINEVLKELEARGILKSDTVNKAIDVVNESTGTLPDLSEHLQEKEDELEKTQVSLNVDDAGNLKLQQPEEQIELNDKMEDLGVTPNSSILARGEDVVQLGVEDLMDDAELADLRAREEQKKKEESDEVDEVLKMVSALENPEQNKEEKSTQDFDIPDTPDNGRYYLDDRYREKFARFLNVTGLENDLARTIYNLREKYDHEGTSKMNNVIVMGEAKSGKTTLAADIIKVANKERGRKGRKIAKIAGANINKKGIMAAMPRLLGCDLIVENAGILNGTMVRQMMSAFSGYTDEMIVVLEDDKTSMERLLETHPGLKDMFGNIITIKEYNIDEWVAYAKAYARENGYTVDDMGTLALYAKIDTEYGQNHGLEKEDVEDIMNMAMDNADGKGIGKLFKKFRSPKEGELKVIREVDFDF